MTIAIAIVFDWSNSLAFLLLCFADDKFQVYEGLCDLAGCTILGNAVHSALAAKSKQEYVRQNKTSEMVA